MYSTTAAMSSAPVATSALIGRFLSDLP